MVLENGCRTYSKSVIRCPPKGPQVKRRETVCSQNWGTCEWGFVCFGSRKDTFRIGIIPSMASKEIGLFKMKESPILSIIGDTPINMILWMDKILLQLAGGLPFICFHPFQLVRSVFVHPL